LAAVPSIGRASRIEGAAAPEADLTRALYEQYANQIFRYCLHQLGSREEAEDAVQSTFLNAFRGIRRGVVPELESAWLFKIAHNVCLSRRRSTWRRGKIESPADFDVVEEIAPAPSRRADELMGLQNVLEAMPENQRRAILLREWQGLSYREIAEELELSQAAVETLIFRARRSLAQGLEQPPEPKRRGVARALDFGNVLAGIKSVLVGGSAAVKVAATVAVVSGTTVVAAAPVQPHHAQKPKAATPASTSSHRSSSGASAGAPGVVAASPAGGLRVAAERRGTQGLAATRPLLPGHVGHLRATAVPDMSTLAPAVDAPASAPAEQQAPPSQTEHAPPAVSGTDVATPAAPAPAAPPASERGKTETRTETRPGSTTTTEKKNDAKGATGDNASGGGKGNSSGKDQQTTTSRPSSTPTVTLSTTTSPTPTVSAPVSAPSPKKKESDDGEGRPSSQIGGQIGGSGTPVVTPPATVTLPAPVLTTPAAPAPAVAVVTTTPAVVPSRPSSGTGSPSGGR
jgi:RNA polymerase sigma factor (sigma-70 family)